MAAGATKKSKRRDERPARKRYWLRRTLEKHKVAHILRYRTEFEPGTALRHWRKVRQGRVPDGWLGQGA